MIKILPILLFCRKKVVNLQPENKTLIVMKHYLIIALSLLFSVALTAQEMEEISWQEREANIRQMFSEIDQMEDNDAITRMADSIQREMIEILMYEDFPFDYEFDLLPNVGCVVSDDGLLYMYSWNVSLKDQNNTSQFYALCYNKALGVTYVLAQGIPSVPSEKAKIADTEWYGAMYYKITPIHVKDDIGYLLLGYAPIDNTRQYKVIDVMSVNKRGIKFGNNIFQKEDGKKYSRIVFQYGRDVQMSLEIDKKKKKILFDHLVEIGQDENGKPIMGPDMSVDSFVLKKGMWIFKGDVDAKNPREKKK